MSAAPGFISDLTSLHVVALIVGAVVGYFVHKVQTSKVVAQAAADVAAVDAKVSAAIAHAKAEFDAAKAKV
jgi:hypothetical protein